MSARYLDDWLNIDNIYFEQMVHRINPAELQLNKAHSSDTEAPFLDLNLSISNGVDSKAKYDKQDDFDMVNFPFFMVPIYLSSFALQDHLLMLVTSIVVTNS